MPCDSRAGAHHGQVCYFAHFVFAHQMSIGPQLTAVFWSCFHVRLLLWHCFRVYVDVNWEYFVQLYINICSIAASLHWLSLLSSFFIWLFGSVHMFNVSRCIREREARHTAPDVDRRFWYGQVRYFAHFVFAHWVASGDCLGIGRSLSLWKCSMYYIQLPFEQRLRSGPIQWIPWKFSLVPKIHIFQVIDIPNL